MYQIDKLIKFAENDIVYITTADTYGKIESLHIDAFENETSIVYGVHLFKPEAVYPYNSDFAFIKQQFLEKVR